MAHKKYQDCIEACQQCASVCEHCATACLNEEDVKSMIRCIALDRDCADFCRFAAALMARDSEEAAHICALCADVCRKCGDECRKHDADHCQECAEACERCAEECDKMAREMAHS